MIVNEYKYIYSIITIMSESDDEYKNDSSSDNDDVSVADDETLSVKPTIISTAVEESDNESDVAVEDEELEDDDDEEEEEDGDEDDEENDDQDKEKKGNNKEKNISNVSTDFIGGAGENYDDDDDDDDEDETNEAYLQKFNADINRQYLVEFHPECTINNYSEINALTNVVRDTNNNIIDKLHRTLPYLTKYERARVLGQRAKQINSGAKAFVKVPENIIDGYLIAELELSQKRIPFIIRRPIPGSGCEYWKLKDLEIIGF